MLASVLLPCRVSGSDAPKNMFFDGEYDGEGGRHENHPFSCLSGN